MTAPLPVRALFASLGEPLNLTWLAGDEAAAQRAVVEAGENVEQLSVVGHLNFIHAHRIQVLGRSEIRYLTGLGASGYAQNLQRLFSGATVAVILTEEQAAPPALLAQAQESHTALLATPQQSDKVIDRIHFHIARKLADRLYLQGVFMEVMGIGVLLAGEPAVGKSELALELLSRGHRLVTDDSTEVVRTAPDTLRGHCPQPSMREFLEVRGLGILDVRAMFGESAIKHSKNLRLIVQLAPADSATFRNLDRLNGSICQRELLEVAVPEVQIPVGPGRNLAVLVEAAARNHILTYHGYHAATALSARQRAAMEE